MGASEVGGVRKSDLLAREFQGRIAEGAWPAGSKLPSERELARAFSVGRAAVREALKVLQLAGDIETRLGEGSFVVEARRGADRGVELVAGQTIMEGLEARQALEIASGVLAMRRASRSDRLKIRAAIAEMEEALGGDDHQWYLSCTFDLHELIAKASHNEFLMRTTDEYVAPMRRDEWLLSVNYDPDVAARSLALHRGIVAELLDGDEGGFVRAVCEHYEDYPPLRHRGVEGAPVVPEG